jgi:hypothetical protein
MNNTDVASEDGVRICGPLDKSSARWRVSGPSFEQEQLRWN